jgi:acyl-CoA synthetase (AMP-forming)/AMP-acid ligase II
VIDRFSPRYVDPELATCYRLSGYWTDDTLGARFEAGLRAHARQPITIHSRQRPRAATVAELADASRRFATSLARHGLGPRDVVVAQLPNWFEALVVMVGSQLAGVTLAPVVHSYGDAELVFSVNHTGARVAVLPDRFGARDFRPSVEALEHQCPSLDAVLVVGDSPVAGALPFSSWLDADASTTEVRRDPDDPAIVGFTSGTTAEPKGVVHTHRTMLAELRHAALAPVPPTPDRPAVVGYPVSHITGMLEVLMPLTTGQPITLLDRWEPGVVLDLLERGHAAPGGATFFVTSLIDDPRFDPDKHLAGLAFQGLGGAPVPPPLVDRLAAMGVQVARGYGCTEHPSVSMGLWDDGDPRRPHTDGTVLPMVEVQVRDEDGKEVGAGTPGELFTRGPDLFAGYVDPALTAAAVVDGWYAIGDVVVIDDDYYLTVVDRVKDIIIRGGENISAAEVEGVLTTVAGVFEAAAVAAPDERFGEHVCAFLQLHPGASAPDLEKVRQVFAAAGVGRQKWPEEIRIVHDFVRTASGKVKKQVLRDQLRAGR